MVDACDWEKHRPTSLDASGTYGCRKGRGNSGRWTETGGAVVQSTPTCETALGKVAPGS